MIEFGEWLPDLPVYANPGATEAKNVLPHGESYKSCPSLTAYSGAISARCQGAASGRDYSGNVHVFAGDASKIYKLSVTTFSDVSKIGGYTCGADSQWSWAQWDNQIIATQVGDPMQVFDLGAGSVFADLSASAPQARYIDVVRDFLVAGNTYDAVDGSVPHRVRWSAIGDPTDWTVSATTQADYQDLNSADGWVQAVVGGEYGTIIQERAIVRMSYVGSPSVFQFDQLEKRGTPAPGSVCKFGSMIPYLGDDGFYIFDGSVSVPISHNKVSKTFYADLDQTYTHNISAAVDPINQLIFWAYPAKGNTGGTPNKLLVYNFSPNATKRWSWVELDMEFVFRAASVGGYTLDTLDSYSANLDALPFSLDSRAWTANAAVLAAFDSSHRLSLFTGNALDAVLETGEAEVTPGRRTRINKIRPLVDGASSVTVQMGTRDTASDSVSWGTSASLNGTGDACVRSNARYHRARVNIAGGFDHAQGVDIIEAVEAGAR